jgi:hypothetical protein
MRPLITVAVLVFLVHTALVSAQPADPSFHPAVNLPLRAAPGDGRDLAGFYAVSNVTDLGEEVRVTLSVRVHNYGQGRTLRAT